MAQINVSNLTFGYEGSYDNIFENVSFCIDTNWRLGFIGRNGKGKTTFLRLLLGDWEYQGAIRTSTAFDYFPYTVTPAQQKRCCAEFLERLKSGCELWRVICELEALELDAEVLYRPFETLSHGERTKVMLAVLFSGENDFLLIDEPTNHLDMASREIVKRYLARKKGFILVSHDRDLLDACIDHVLVLNRQSIEVQAGNFSTWWENKSRKDAFVKAENEKHRKEIGKLKQASERARSWAAQNENSKIGFNPVTEHDRFIDTRAYIGAKTKKMQSRVKQLENRIAREIEEKEGLLCDVETPAELKLMPLAHYKDRLVWADKYGIIYPASETGTGGGDKKTALCGFSFELHQGERVFLHGKNGCGKSSFLRAVLDANAARADAAKAQAAKGYLETGTLTTAPGLVISYVDQDASFLRGSIWDMCRERGLDEARFCALLRQLDMERVQFEKNMEDYSEGQKKKVLLAASLLQSAHLYIWDEPLNYIDVFSRMQLEALILKYRPTMLAVEHDARFREQLATRVVEM